MAKKSATSSNPTASKPTPTTGRPFSTTTTSSSPPQPSSKSSATATRANPSPQDVIVSLWNEYLQNTPSRTFLLDAFLAFLVVIGAIQFLYAILFGNYPFNAFLSGFCAAVGQFVLTVSLRMQTTERLPSTASADAKRTAARKIDGAGGGVVEEQQQQEDGKGNGDGEWRGHARVSSERAFADFVFGSLILHGFCVNFIN